MKINFKKLFCRHKRKKQIKREYVLEGYMIQRYGTECKNCGKVWLK